MSKQLTADNQDLDVLGSVASVRSGYAFKSGDMGKVGAPIIKIKNIVPPNVGTADCERIPDEVIASIPNVERYAIGEGDILIAMTGATVGKVGRFPFAQERFYLNQRVGKVYLTNTDKADYRYLFYVLSQDAYVQQMFGAADGSAQANISGTQIERLKIPLPSRDRQRAIAHILGTLDDKIELNRRMNETLEAMARAIFKSWFVDFDPVRAKASGEPPESICRRLGLTPEVLALFPDSFQDSELGEIPKGWRVGSLFEQARLLSGGTPKTARDDYWGGPIRWASAKDVSQCREAFLIDTERMITPIGLAESATQLIPALSTVVVSRGATTGCMVILGDEMAMNQTCYALVSTTASPFWLYCTLQERITSLVQSAHGSIFDTITTTTFNNTQFLLPPLNCLVAIESAITPIFHRILAAAKEAAVLADARDSFLPKLLSGDLRPPSARSALETLT